VSSRSLARRIGGSATERLEFYLYRGDGDSIKFRFGLPSKTRVFLLPLVLVQTLAVLPPASDAQGRARPVVVAGLEAPRQFRGVFLPELTSHRHLGQRLGMAPAGYGHGWSHPIPVPVSSNLTRHPYPYLLMGIIFSHTHYPIG
jgi:hypothetical protein